jgi:hypothetical protein
MWIILTIVVLLAIIVAAYLVSCSRYYGRMFSDAHLSAFHGALLSAIQAARSKHTNNEPRLTDGTAFVTDAGLGVGVTLCSQNDGVHALHISMSQTGRYTTHSVCSRFGFFVVAMLGRNQFELLPYFTASSVHHLVFRLHSPDITLQNFAATYAQYRNEYKPIQFQYRDIEGP